ncbi:MAG: hypothetical protein QOH37_3153 [Nocardioidaceae bacterium]|jgi:hypothetical protein|nr:hypothetical protein [Nocardioidaceae bacterium]
MGLVERSGKHAAPRHAAQSSDQPTEPVRIDASRLDPVAGGAPSAATSSSSVLLLALGITAAVVAWGYLVYLAIDFGTAARDGDATGWWMLAMATIGAIACLFVGMLLGTRFVQRLRGGGAAPSPPRAPGGRRAAR